MESNGKHALSGDDIARSTWVVINCGANRFIGRVVALDHKKVEGEVDTPYKATEMEAVLDARVVTLNPCFDFFAPLRPVAITGQDGKPEMVAPNIPKMGMGRDPFVATHDFTLQPNPVHVIIGPGVAVDFFSEMDPSDRDTYVGFVTAASKAAVLHRAAKAGLQAPSEDEVHAVDRSRG